MHWILLALLAPLSWGLTNIFDKVLYEKYVKDSLSLSVILGLVDVFMVVGLYFAVGFAPVDLQYHAALFGIGILYVGLIFLYVKALSMQETSRVIPVMQSAPVFVLLISAVFFHENLQLHQYLAFFLMLSGGVLISIKRGAGMVRLSVSFWLILLASFIVAIQQLAFKFAMPHYPSVWHGFLIFYTGIFLGMVVLVLVVPSLRNRLKVSAKQLGVSGLWLCLLNNAVTFLALWSFVEAVAVGPVSLVSVMGSMQPLFVLFFTIVLARRWGVYLKEELNFRVILFKLVAILLTLGGVILLAL